MSGHLLGVLEPSVVLQINRDAGCAHTGEAVEHLWIFCGISAYGSRKILPFSASSTGVVIE
jgi:hypothetical protein